MDTLSIFLNVLEQVVGMSGMIVSLIAISCLLLLFKKMPNEVRKVCSIFVKLLLSIYLLRLLLVNSLVVLIIRLLSTYTSLIHLTIASITIALVYGVYRLSKKDINLVHKFSYGSINRHTKIPIILSPRDIHTSSLNLRKSVVLLN